MDDFLCIGESLQLRWLFGALQKEYDLKHHILDPGRQEDVRYVNRILGVHGIEWECDAKHVRTPVGEFEMEGCKVKGTPITKDGPDKSMEGEPSEPEGQ